ncbi:HpcH/HpaI aldolase/citrate lyase family protein, partial [Streptomyces nigra]
ARRSRRRGRPPACPAGWGPRKKHGLLRAYETDRAVYEVLYEAPINMKSLVVGEQPPGYPADAYHYILMKILMAARANDLQAIDGPYLQIRNVDGYREVAQRAAALGFDGKWVLHPGQVEASNEIFSPSQEDYDHAELILDAYDYYTSEAGGKKGSAMLGDEMIDEASRKMALVIAGKGRAAGMKRTSKFEIPEA